MDLDVAATTRAQGRALREKERERERGWTGVAYAENLYCTLATEETEATRTERNEWRGSKKRGRFADQEYDATLVKASAKKRLPCRTECRSR